MQYLPKINCSLRCQVVLIVGTNLEDKNPTAVEIYLN